MNAERLSTLLDLKAIPKYGWSLFTAFLDELKLSAQRGTLWINEHELERAEYREIKAALFGDGKLFDALSIDKESIPSVQEYRWRIGGDEYEQLRALSVAEYASSPLFRYDVNGEYDISFHLRCYGQFTADNPQCAVFVEIDEMPDSLKALRIEVDFKAKMASKEHRQLLKTKMLTKEKRVCGFQMFDSEQLDSNTEIEWVIGVKIFSAEHAENHEEEQYYRDLYRVSVFA